MGELREIFIVGWVGQYFSNKIQNDNLVFLYKAGAWSVNNKKGRSMTLNSWQKPGI